MTNIKLLTKNIYDIIFSYLYPSLNNIRLINKTFAKYVWNIINKHNRIKHIDDIIEFNHIHFEKMLNILSECKKYRFLRLNYLIDTVDICKLIQIIHSLNTTDIIIFILNSDICITESIQTYKLYLNNCNVKRSLNKICVNNTKYIEFNKINNTCRVFSLLELTNVYEFVCKNFKNTHMQMIEMNDCKNYMIYNIDIHPFKISFPNGDFILKNGEKICRKIVG